MMNNTTKFTGGAVLHPSSLESQIDLFLFDLHNEAKEHGFKPDESWALELATEQEITSFKRIHHPVISLRLHSPGLLTAYKDVKSKLKQSLSTADTALTDKDLISNDKLYLTAYPVRNTR